MSVNVVLNGVTFTIPDPGDNTWGQELTDYFVALGSGVLQKAGGTFTLTAEVNFGATYGLKSVYYKSRATNPSSTGQVRLGNTEFIGWRNAANDDDMELAVDASDQLTYNGHAIIPSTALTASRALVTNGSGVITTAATTATEIGYVAGVTSAIQTQLDGKQAAGSYITALTGDVTASGPGSSAATIGANKVLDTMIRQSAGLSVIGRSANTTGNVADITAGTDNFVLRRSGTALGFGLLVNANIDSAAAIDFSKLASLTSAHILVGSAGNVATDVAVTGDVAISNAGVTAIGANKVTLAMMAQVATATFLGRTTASTGNVEALTVTQATALLNAFVGDSGSGGTKGLVPAPASGDAAANKFLKASGVWAVPAGAGDVVGPASAHDGGLVLFNSTTGKLIKESTLTQHNMVIAGANGTVTSLAPGAARNVTISDGTDWASRALVSADLAGAIPNSSVYVDTGNGHGSTNTKVRRYSNTRLNTGSDITYADSATNGASFTINTAGVYFMKMEDQLGSGQAVVGITVNGSALTTAVDSITYAQGRRSVAFAAASNSIPVACCTLILAVNDVVRPCDDGTNNDTSAASNFLITRVS